MSSLLKAAGSVASSLAGSLFSKGSKKQTNKLKLGQLVKNAQKHGFNPLTVLTATGGAGYTTQASANDLDFGSMAASAALQGFGDYWASQEKDDLRQAQVNLANAQAETLRAQASARTMAGPFQGPSAARGRTPDTSDNFLNSEDAGSVVKKVTGPTGRDVYTTEGPDLDEMITGGLLAATDYILTGAEWVWDKATDESRVPANSPFRKTPASLPKPKARTKPKTNTRLKPTSADGLSARFR